MRKYLANFKETQNALIRQHKEDTRNNPLSSLWQDQHNNTYTRTLEQIKQYINDDSQKELDALKNSITKMAGNDVDLVPYGELLISAAEEYAVHTNHGINNNFIKMSSVFNLENQKNLIELIQATQAENEKEVEKRKAKIDDIKKKRDAKKDVKKGKELYEKKLKDSTKTYTLETFEEEFGDDIKSLKEFFVSDEGKDAYKELVEKNPLYKYLLEVDPTSLNTLLNCINNLKVVETTSDNFYKTIVKKDQTLYYIMADRSIKDAIESKTSEAYFGFENIDDDKDYDDKSKHIIKPNTGKSLLSSSIFFQSAKTKKYFLTFKGSGDDLFDILHKDFKTEIFDSKKEYVKNISTESKETIMKLIYKNLKIGNSITTQFAEYLVRLEAHMLLEKRNPWFVVEDNEALKDCFNADADEIQNKNAFVEINVEDYDDIKSFLSKYHILAESDFDTSSKNNNEDENK
jgi:hypothetical protein